MQIAVEQRIIPIAPLGVTWTGDREHDLVEAVVQLRRAKDSRLKVAHISEVEGGWKFDYFTARNDLTQIPRRSWTNMRIFMEKTSITFSSMNEAIESGMELAKSRGTTLTIHPKKEEK